MYESDNPVPAEAPDVPPVKQGMSKVLLVSLIVNAVLVVGIIIGFLVFQNKMEKTQMEADQAVSIAQTKLHVLKAISRVRDKLGDKKSLSDIGVIKPTYPYYYCKEFYTKGTSRKKVDEELLSSKGPEVASFQEGNTVKYKFDYDTRFVTIIIEYDKEGPDGQVQSIDYISE